VEGARVGLHGFVDNQLCAWRWDGRGFVGKGAGRAWLDADLDSNVQLLESIQTGTFLDSNSGRYLQSLRDRFRGEDLADMLCCVRLHSELALRAKGVLLLRESGMEELPIDAETREKLAELAQLERAIGRTGVLALRPLIMATGKEIWQLTLLGRK